MLDAKKGFIENEVRPNVEDVLRYFSVKSGYDEKILRELFAELLPLFTLPFKQVTDRLLSKDPVLATSLVNNISALQHRLPLSDLIGTFWRDIFSYLLQNDLSFRKSHEHFYNIIAGNAFVKLLREQKMITEHSVDFEKDLREEDRERLTKKAENTKSSFEKRVFKVQSGLETAREICMTVLQNGRIPITRILFFSSEQEKIAFIEKSSVGNYLTPRGHIPLESLTLKNIEDHSQNKTEAHPLESWTYISPSSPWRYGQSRLGWSHAVILVSSIDNNELMWARNLHGNYGVQEEWQFYEEKNLEASPIQHPEKAQLSEFQKKNVKCIAIPTEGEVIVWDTLQLQGVIDLGP